MMREQAECYKIIMVCERKVTLYELLMTKKSYTVITKLGAFNCSIGNFETLTNLGP